MKHQTKKGGSPGESSIGDSAILPADKMAGLGLHFTSLPGPHGIGDIGDGARRFVDMLGRMKIAYWQFLPTGPTAYGDSPYQPLSAFAGNEMLIGIDPLVRLGLLSEDDERTLSGLSHGHVNYGELIPRKQLLLAKAADCFQSSAGPGLKRAYEEFIHQHGGQWLEDYAIYRVLKTMHAERPWPECDTSFVHRESAAMRNVWQNHRDAIEHIKIIQFLFDQQWQMLKNYANERRVKLFGDMPIYIALDSADAWAHPEILLINEDGRPSHVAGVPPDYFSADGQLWGNPLYDWKFHRSSGFQWWIERMQHALSQMDLVRIDHFRGFESFWSVPFGAETARSGEWLPGPQDGLFDALQTALGKVPIVAEDLGVITREVDELRHRHHIPGMKVLQFEVADPDFDPDEIDAQSVCYTGTHDNDTTVGWFNGGDQDTRSEQEILETRKNVLKTTGGSAGTVHMDMIRLAFNCKARLAIAPLQDFLGLGSEARMNIPGSTLNNWRWRFVESQITADCCDTVVNIVEDTSRF
jgi:4-alpha-glucanotransferase